MDKRTYATRDEAIEREIIVAIEAGEASRDEYDIDSIADEVLGDYAQGFALRVGPEAFWEVVARHAL